MRYCLVHKKSRKVVPLFCKRELLDWIAVHFFALSFSLQREWSVHRMRVCRHGSHGHFLVMAGERICSLQEYIIKHQKTIIHYEKFD